MDTYRLTDIQLRERSKSSLLSTTASVDSDECTPVDSAQDSVIEVLNDRNEYEKVPVSWSQAYRKFYQKHEVPRKLFHLFTGFFTIWLYVNGYDPSIFTIPFVTATIIITSVDFIRFRYEPLNKLFFKIFGPIMRPSEMNQYNGTIYFLVGLIFNTHIMPKDLCVVSSLVLSWGDTSASFFGREWGKYTPQLRKGKSLAGSLASFLTGCLSCAFFYGYLLPKYHHAVDLPGDIFYHPETSSLPLWMLIIITGVASSVSEFIDIYGIDDNLTIPVISGSVLWSVIRYFN